MSHKSGHIIIFGLKETGKLTAEQTAAVDEIENRDEYTLTDRAYLAWLTFRVCTS